MLSMFLDKKVRNCELAMAEGSQKLGASKPTVFAAINGNLASHSTAPVVVPKFKISRGTQANTFVQKNATKMSPSPPVPAKPASLLRQTKSPAPPVPPKPGSASKVSPTKPVVAPKPSLPPKPLVRPCNSATTPREPPVPPSRPQRSRCENFNQIEYETITTFQEKLPVNSAQLVVKQQSRKSASLGRLEGVRCCALLVRQQADERCLQRDSGFISCSLENVGKPTPKFTSQHKDIPITSLPIAPPRRRRKSADSYEPIYAVIDFSKKRNRRLLLAQEQSNNGNQEQSVEKLTDNKETDAAIVMEKIQPVNSESGVQNESETVLEVSSSNPVVPSNQMDTDIELIENSFAAIASLMESFNHNDSAPPTPSVTDQTFDSRNGFNSSADIQREEEHNDVNNTVIARLVFGGTVVQQTNFIAVRLGHDFICYH